MKKSNRNKLWLTGGIVFLFFLSWLTAQLLVSRYKHEIHDIAVAEINHRIQGNVTLRSVKPAFLKTFPNLSVCLTDLVVRDSLWDQHHHDLMRAEKIYISFGWLSLLKGKPEVCKVIIQNGAIHLYKDACGYSNLVETKHIRSTEPHHTLPEFSLKHTRLTIENELLNAMHDIDADHLNCQITRQDSALVFHLNIKSVVHGIGFNLEKGSYLREKKLNGSFYLTYFPEDRMILKNVNLEIDHKPFNVNGMIFLDSDTMSYDLHIRTDQIVYAEAYSLLTQSLQQRLKSVAIDKPIDVSAAIAGKMAPKVIPRISTAFTVNGAVMETPIGRLENCSYTGTFNNHVDSCLVPGDPNTTFTFLSVTADWNQITLKSGKLEINNLLSPFLTCDIKADFPLTALNTIGESATLQFLKGTGKLDIQYQGSISNHDTIRPVLNGLLTLQDAELHYLPRDLLFKNCSGQIVFMQQDLVLKNFLATTGQSTFTMNGQITNLMAMLNLNPEQLTIDMTISTPMLDLGDFISYVKLPVASQPKKVTSKNKIIMVTEQTDKMLRDGTLRLNVLGGEVRYKKFKASQVKASLLLEGNKVTMKDVSLRHAGGTASMKGTLTNGANTNFIMMESRIKAMDIPQLFKAFDNFGQDAVTAANTKGQLSANIGMACELTDKAVVRENSMKGTVEFSVINGELNQFEPVMKITEVAFKKRDFSQIRFAELKNTLEITGSAFQIRKMEIRANVVVLFVEGIYDTKKGTDMSIQVPISNLSKAENDVMENKGKAGVNIRLRAKTGADGKLNVSWDPLNNASRQRKSEIKSDVDQVTGKKIQ